MDIQKFIVEVLRQAFIDNQPHYCEQIFLVVRASSTDEAGKKAEAFSKSQEHEFKNPQGQNVAWKFIRVLEVSPVVSDHDGDVVEIQSHIYQTVESFDKAMGLRGSLT
jgi:Domain of unknown function (DUF4288)